jgi:Rod binding domain-containing protein
MATRLHYVMYSDVEMAHRMQITLTDEQYRQLLQRSTASGSSIAEIVRRAIDANEAEAGARERLLATVIPSTLTREQRHAALDAARGIWADRGDEVYEQWHHMRGHDLIADT